MRIWLTLALLMFAAGAALRIHADSLPMYKEPGAFERLEREFSQPVTAANNSAEVLRWYALRKELETPRKKLSDLSDGLMAAGAGLGGAVFFAWAYGRYTFLRSRTALVTVWVSLWLFRIALTALDYAARSARHDYPWFSDSIAIPIASESMACLFGAGISSIFLVLLWRNRVLPPAIRVSKPETRAEWVRAIFVGIWVTLIGFDLAGSIPFGDVGAIFAEPVATIILLAVLAARRTPRICLEERSALGNWKDFDDHGARPGRTTDPGR